MSGVVGHLSGVCRALCFEGPWYYARPLVGMSDCRNVVGLSERLCPIGLGRWMSFVGPCCHISVHVVFLSIIYPLWDRPELVTGDPKSFRSTVP
eukprot:5738443-Prymnesium_polylepis.1